MNAFTIKKGKKYAVSQKLSNSTVNIVGKAIFVGDHSFAIRNKAGTELHFEFVDITEGIVKVAKV